MMAGAERDAESQVDLSLKPDSISPKASADASTTTAGLDTHALAFLRRMGTKLSKLLPSSTEQSEAEKVAMNPDNSSASSLEQGPTKGTEKGAGTLEIDPQELAQRAPWVRAALLGAQDGLVSVSSLMIGVHAISGHRSSMVISGIAGLVAGACSMAIGEYVSVASERDITETALRRERAKLEAGPASAAIELDKLTETYVERGLSYTLARQVAEELSAKDPLRAHARDELGVDMDDLPKPEKAAMASAICFVVGAIVPLLSAAFIVTNWLRVLVVLLVSSTMFVAFGFFGAWLGGAPTKRAALRTLAGGLFAVAITYLFLSIVGWLGVADERFMRELL